MKRSTLTSATLCLLLLGGALAASAQDRSRAASRLPGGRSATPQTIIRPIPCFYFVPSFYYCPPPPPPPTCNDFDPAGDGKNQPRKCDRAQ